MNGAPAIQASTDEFLAAWVTWSRFRGASYGTVVLKATFALLHGRAAEVDTPEPILWLDRMRKNGSLDRADDIAPFVAGGSVLVHGFAYASTASQRDPVYARVAVGVERPIIDKTIAVIKSGRIPLVWEEAYLTHDNPVGTEEPSIVDPRLETRAIGFGPIAPSWEGRIKYLPSPIGHNAEFLELPSQIDARFFNSAPPDQQCQPFTGTEAIILTNLVPGSPELQSWLPAVSVRTQVSIDGAAVPAAFTLDTMTIDAETAHVNLVWRATIPLPQAMKGIAIQAMLAGSFERIRWSARVAPAPPPQEVAPVIVVPPPKAPEPPPPPVEHKLVRVENPRGAVIERISAKKSLEDLDLSGADLHDIDFTERSLAYSKLDGANLKGAKLNRAKLSHASLVGASLEGAKLDGADLESANLSKVRADKASFVKANLVHANLEQASLNGAVLDDADLSDVDATRAGFSEAKLRRVKANRAKLDRTSLVAADFEYASLDFANLERASMDEASFVGASFADANLEKSIAEGARFSKARLVRANLSQTRLVSAIATGVDATGAKFERADLSKARLDGATLDGANLTGAKCINADFTGATLDGTVLAGADLTGARLKNTDRSKANLTGANLKNVIE